MTRTDCLRQLQEEQKPWVKHNFGDRGTWMPFFGIIEELGEHCEALDDAPPGEVDAKAKDALADAMIFAADYCSAMGWDFGDLWEAALTYGSPPVSLLRALGKTAHAHLKAAQGIRVNENHAVEGRMGMIYILVHLKFMAEFDLVDETYRVWQKVKLRDWKKDPAHAGEAQG